MMEWNSILEKQPREGVEVFISIDRRSISTVSPFTQYTRHCRVGGVTKDGSITIHDLANGGVEEDKWDSFFDLSIHGLGKYSRFVRGNVVENITHWTIPTPPQKEK